MNIIIQLLFIGLILFFGIGVLGEQDEEKAKMWGIIVLFSVVALCISTWVL